MVVPYCSFSCPDIISSSIAISNHMLPLPFYHGWICITKCNTDSSLGKTFTSNLLILSFRFNLGGISNGCPYLVWRQILLTKVVLSKWKQPSKLPLLAGILGQTQSRLCTGSIVIWSCSNVRDCFSQSESLDHSCCWVVCTTSGAFLFFQ